MLALIVHSGFIVHSGLPIGTKTLLVLLVLEHCTAVCVKVLEGKQV